MDSFFKQRFNAGKCKTLLKLTIPRIKLLRNRRDIQIKQMRKEIAKLLETGQEATARIRVEHIIREEKMMAAQEIVELFAELIVVRLPIIDAQRECPLDLKEAISSVCFAAPRCADLPELIQVQILFSGKYGKDFVAAASELMPECGVNRQLLELLSVRAPAPEMKLKLLKDIAEEHELDWDPSASERELLKTHEDLLTGPSQFTSGYKLPLIPREEKKHDEVAATHADDDAAAGGDDDFDMIDFPEVPKMPLNNASVPEMLPFPVSALSDKEEEEEEEKDPDHVVVVSEKVEPPALEQQKDSGPAVVAKQRGNVDLQDVLAAAQAAAETAERAAAAARSAATIAQLRISELVESKNKELRRLPDGLPCTDSIKVDSPHQHQPQRLPSMDDETYFSYPNLFSRHSSTLSNSKV